MFDYIIGHETKSKYLPFIRRYGLLKSSLVPNEVVGQGSQKQKLTDDPTYYLDYVKGRNEFDSVDAVYFRLFTDMSNLRPQYGGDVIIIMDPSCLKGGWYFNTTENFGFYLDGESPFTGEEGDTLFSFSQIEKIDQSVISEGELVVLNNVSPACLKDVIYF